SISAPRKMPVKKPPCLSPVLLREQGNGCRTKGRILFPPFSCLSPPGERSKRPADGADSVEWEDWMHPAPYDARNAQERQILFASAARSVKMKRMSYRRPPLPALRAKTSHPGTPSCPCSATLWRCST